MWTVDPVGVGIVALCAHFALVFSFLKSERVRRWELRRARKRAVAFVAKVDAETPAPRPSKGHPFRDAAR